jgi:hypothetical protein
MPVTVLIARNEFPNLRAIEVTSGAIKYTCNCPDYLKAILKQDGSVSYSWGTPDNECWHIAAVRYYNGEELPLVSDIPIEDLYQPKLSSSDPLSKWARKMKEARQEE